MIYPIVPVGEAGGDERDEGCGGIEESVLNEIYKDLDVDVSLLYTKPTSGHEVRYKYLVSKLWRMNNLYTIIDKDGRRVPFVMNLSQHKVYAAILTWYRLIILKSRQQGVSTFWLICYFDDGIFYPDLNIGLMAQGKGEANKLLKRVKLAWRELDPLVLRGLSISTDNKDEIGFTNNSTIYIAVSFRSATLQRLHVSELGKIANNFPERARELRTGTFQTVKPGNPIVVESTADGENLFKDMWESAVKQSGAGGGGLGPKDFLPLFLSWLEDPDCVSYVDEEISIEDAKYFKTIGEPTKAQKNFWIMQKRELGDDIYQEYPSTPVEAFIAVKDGTYYARLYAKWVVLRGREVADLYDDRWSVQVAMDLGMNDTFVLVYYQRVNGEVKIIDEYYNSGYEIAHYVKHMADSGYTITNVEIPHDGSVRDLQTGVTRKRHMADLGVRNIHQLSKSSIDDGIDAVRRMLPNMYIDAKCTYLTKCITKYTKEYNETFNVWRDKPLHNEASNGADAIRCLAMGNCVDSKRLDLLPTAKRPDGVYDGMSF